MDVYLEFLSIYFTVNIFNINNIQKKVKEKVIIKDINTLKLDTIDICIINTKYPIWSIFANIEFNIVLLETQKNIDQMDSILKNNGYILFDNLYFNKKLLIKKGIKLIIRNQENTF